MTIKIYGIKNCDTVRKARKWLSEQGLEFEFRDIRDNPLDQQEWLDIVNNTDTDILVNKRGTSWRKLDDASKSYNNADELVSLFIQQPTIMKRPLLIIESDFHIGFKPDQYAEIFS